MAQGDNSRPETDVAAAVPVAGPESGRLKRLLAKLIFSRHMLWGIGLASFLEAIIIPIPLETILIPLMQARRDRIWAITTVVLLGCLMAAVLGYGVGYFLFEAVGREVISMVSTQEEFEGVREQMEEKGFWFVFGVGVAPIPFQIAMLAAGATKYSLGGFLVASALSRGIRYFGLAALVYFAGNRAQRLFERHKKTTAVVLLAVVLIIWIVAFVG